jgi:hypothetical protein
MRNRASLRAAFRELAKVAERAGAHELEERLVEPPCLVREDAIRRLRPPARTADRQILGHSSCAASRV